ncbi:ATP-dependent helicase [Deinococcus sp.]|uniref:ATP-dependent helicase n=1 Tax=Deinococcus sp. TaxID=47478 RepID=UPI003B5A4D72
MIEPTAEQQQIITHTSGHSLVFAVAGSGKTATMVERIRHLVTHEHVRAVRILACTFSRAAKETIEARLAKHPETAGVTVSTIHALAYRIIQAAVKLGFTDLRLGEAHFSRKLYQQARQELIDEAPDERSAYFNIKYEDFQTYLSVQKGSLRLPHCPDHLPAEAQQLIGEPDRGVDLYAELYARHDALRQREGKLDFDDCLVEAWRLMVEFPELRENMAGRWDYVHVDEFQDVNLAQSEMLHLLAATCKSYTAIGDDDQTVYQWRGANPHLILNFAQRYDAQTFTLTTNFRCPMGVIALADQVIGRNMVRSPKRLRASRGGNGVFLHSADAGQAARVATQAMQGGRRTEEIVILVRTYAQTGEIEQVLLEEEIPYVIVGSLPFYQRQEVAVLLAYLNLALADLEMQRQGAVAPQRRIQLLKDWQRVANVPNRYLSRTVISEMERGLWRNGQTLARALMDRSPQLRGSAAEEACILSEALTLLTDDLALASGKEALLDFADRIRYTDHLIRTAPTTEFGEERSGSVRALAEMAAHRSLGELVAYIAFLNQHAQPSGDTQDDAPPRLTIMTAFRAKGLEWPVVIVPGCSKGLYNVKDSADRAAAEEERRVFYVALTRAQHELHLIEDGAETTPLLTVIHHRQLVGEHRHLTELLETDPLAWSASDTLEMAELLLRYGHQNYVQQWLASNTRERLLQRIQALSSAIKRRTPEFHDQAQTLETLDLATYRPYGDLPASADAAHQPFDDLEDLIGRLILHHQPTEGTASPEQRLVSSTSLTLTPRSIRRDMRIEHRRFGLGTVIALAGLGDRMEAEVRFDRLDATKRMVVIYANLFAADTEDGAVLTQTPDDPLLPFANTWFGSPQHLAQMQASARDQPVLDIEWKEEDLPF